jgi:hypothetical protein
MREMCLAVNLTGKKSVSFANLIKSERLRVNTTMHADDSDF